MMATANKLSAPTARTNLRSKAWIERQRKFYEQLHSDEGGFEFIEFLDGDIIVRAMPEDAHLPEGATLTFDMPTTIQHQRIQSRLIVALSNFVNQHHLGEVFGTPTDLKLGTNTTQPDIIFLSKEHASRAKSLEINGYADLVVEILSKSSIKRDRQTKFRLYQDAKIPSY
jgi:Uma2 family endonuclease